MKIYDISQEVFSCAVYPGDPQPEKQTLYSTEAGDLYNLTSFAMCAHNGTHIDAPFHFLHKGKTVDQMDLAHFVGDCFVTRHEGDVTAADAEEILEKAGGAERILIAGKATVTAEAAEVLINQFQAKLLTQLNGILSLFGGSPTDLNHIKSNVCQAFYGLAHIVSVCLKLRKHEGILFPFSFGVSKRITQQDFMFHFQPQLLSYYGRAVTIIIA